MLGLKINIGKSLCGSIVHNRKSWVTEHPKLTLRNGDNLKTIKESDLFDYLGIKFSLKEGINNDLIIKQIPPTLANIKRLPLKPRQKINLALQYVLPRLFYSLGIKLCTKTIIKDFDLKLKAWIKEILHLHPSTTDGVIYTKKRNGGLGVIKLEYNLAGTYLRAGLSLIQSDDYRIRYFNMLNRLEPRLEKIAQWMNLSWPTNRESTKIFIKSLYWKETDRWESQLSMGKGVNTFRNDSIGNKWLTEDKLLKDSAYINALKMRTNTFPTRIACSRADKNIDTKCRKCFDQEETLAHVLGSCKASKNKYIKRHDDLKHLVAEKLIEKGYEVDVEREVHNGNGEITWKPDLVAVKERKATVIDVSVRFEEGDSLKKAGEEKIEKYGKTMHSQLFSMYNVDTG